MSVDLAQLDAAEDYNEPRWQEWLRVRRGQVVTLQTLQPCEGRDGSAIAEVHHLKGCILGAGEDRHGRYIDVVASQRRQRYYLSLALAIAEARPEL